jgi:hypothetical protein
MFFSAEIPLHHLLESTVEIMKMRQKENGPGIKSPGPF